MLDKLKYRQLLLDRRLEERRLFYFIKYQGEKSLVELIQEGIVNIPIKRINCILNKWVGLHIYEYDVNILYGWLEVDELPTKWEDSILDQCNLPSTSPFNALGKSCIMYNSINNIFSKECILLRDRCQSIIRDDSKKSNMFYIISSELVSLIAHVNLLMKGTQVTLFTLSQKIYNIYGYTPYVIIPEDDIVLMEQLPKSYNILNIINIIPKLKLDETTRSYKTFMKMYNEEIQIIEKLRGELHV